MTEELHSSSIPPVDSINLTYAPPRMAPMVWPYTLTLCVIGVPMLTILVIALVDGFSALSIGMILGVYLMILLPIPWLIALTLTAIFCIQARRRELDPRFSHRRRNLIAAMAGSFMIFAVCWRFAASILQAIGTSGH